MIQHAKAKDNLLIVVEINLNLVHISVEGAARGLEGKEKTHRLDGRADRGSGGPF